MKRRKTLASMIIMVLMIMMGCTASETSDKEYQIFDNYNTYAVYNQAKEPSQFTINEPHVITHIDNYHWNDQQGSPPGTIGLEHSDGTIYGPWQATSRNGQWDTPNAYWIVEPSVEVKAGTYTILDSEPATWSQNSQSNGIGFSQVRGYSTGDS